MLFALERGQELNTDASLFSLSFYTSSDRDKIRFKLLFGTLNTNYCNYNYFTSAAIRCESSVYMYTMYSTVQDKNA